jgi:hypothetical protein
MGAMFGRKHLVADYREFTRELLLWFDRSQREHREALFARLDESLRVERDQVRAMFCEHAESRRVEHEEVRRRLDQIDADLRDQSRKTDDLIEENRAQRQPLLLSIDELRGNGGPATA